MTTIIKQDDLITSVKDALQFISYYHPQDFIQAMSRAYDREENQAARMRLHKSFNSRMCAEGHRPICQDTGSSTFSLKWA
jgi:fumarate hydratase class I